MRSRRRRATLFCRLPPMRQAADAVPFSLFLALPAQDRRGDMPELVTCPACGFKTQMAEGLLGRRVRCPGCDNRFVAAADPEPPAEPHRPAPPSRPVLPGRP